MIHKETLYTCTCNGCGEYYEDRGGDYYLCVPDKSTLKEVIAQDDEWVTVKSKHYCPKCAKTLTSK